MPDFERRFTLAVPSSTENLALIRDFIGNIGHQAGLDESEVHMLALAVDEACSNVMEHAYEHDQTKDVTVRVRLDGEMLELVVIDTGKGFDPGAVEQKDLRRMTAERRSGGLGMRMMKALMDEVKYEIIPGVKNELRMVKRLKKAPVNPR